MSEGVVYQHKSVQKLNQLYLDHKDSMGKGISMMSMLWKAIEPQIPEMLISLDENPERLATIGKFLIEMAETFKEEAGAKGI
jgi:hypothetical protein